MSLTGCARNLLNHLADRNPKNWQIVYSNSAGFVQKNKISGHTVSGVQQHGLGSTNCYPGDCFTPKNKHFETTSSMQNHQFIPEKISGGSYPLKKKSTEEHITYDIR